MIWLTWRQHRGEAFVALVGPDVLAAFLLITGVSINVTYQQPGVGKRLGIAAAPNCADVVDAVRQETGFWRGFTLWLTFVPMVLAMLVGAPLVAREFEQGTFRLV